MRDKLQGVRTCHQLDKNNSKSSFIVGSNRILQQ